MKKTVLYLSYDGLTDPLGQSQILPYMLGVADSGVNIIIISFEKRRVFEINRLTIEVQIHENSERITWYPLIYTKYPPILSTVWDIIKLKRKIATLDEKIDIVHCRSYITSLVGLMLKRSKGVPFVFDMRGFWADERVEGGIWNLNNPFIKFVFKYFKRKEKEFLMESDHTISLTYKAAEIIQRWKLKPSPLSISIIPTCVDTTIFDVNNIDRGTSELKRQALKIDRGQFIITYIGSLGSWYMLDEMLDFFSVLLTKIPEAVFLIVTKDEASFVWRKVRERNIDTARIRVTSASRTEVPVLINISDWSIFFIKPVFSKSASAPTKLAEITALGKPVVCNSGVGDIDNIFKYNYLGVCLSSFTKDEYKKTVDLMLENKRKSVDTEFVKQSFGLNIGLSKLLDIYGNLTNNQNYR